MSQKKSLIPPCHVSNGPGAHSFEEDRGKGSTALFLLPVIKVFLNMKNLIYARLNAEAQHINFVQVIYHNIHHSHQCFYCETSLNKTNRTRDHLIPRERAYSHTSILLRQKLGAINILPACKECNHMKGNKSLLDFRTWLKQNRPNGYKTMIRNIDKILHVPAVYRIRMAALKFSYLFL